MTTAYVALANVLIAVLLRQWFAALGWFCVAWSERDLVRARRELRGQQAKARVGI